MNQIQQENADLIALGEIFNCPYEAGKFPLYAEPEGRQIARHRNCPCWHRGAEIYMR